MNYWILTFTPQKFAEEFDKPEEVFQLRMRDRFWGLGEKTPNRRSLEKGDQVVFYIGLPQKVFAGQATLATPSYMLREEKRDAISHGKSLLRAEYGVDLESVQTWEKPRRVEDMVAQLEFIENRQSWYVYFQGGIRQINERDFRIITEGTQHATVEEAKATEEITSPSEFALEAHLEDFIHKNWDQIDFGSNLLPYRTEEQDGRQFPAGPWSIDFLCTDRDTGDLVVVELKRGKTSDSTVGQVLRYVSWVKDKLAQPGQDVRGLIITKEIDEAMRYAVKNLPQIDVLTYKIDFRLSLSPK